MPATEASWRNVKLLHQVFAASSLLLLGATIWMFAADHNREWKRQQQQFRRVELSMNDWQRLQQDTEEVVARHEALAADALREGSQPFPTVPVDVLGEFKAKLESEARRRGAAAPSFAHVERLRAKLNGDSKANDDDARKGLAQLAAEARAKAEQARAEAEQALAAADQADAAAAAATAAVSSAADREAGQAAEKAAKAAAKEVRAAAREKRGAAEAVEHASIEAAAAAKAVRAEIVAALETLITSARFVENSVLTERKFTSATLDAKKSQLGLAVRDDRSASDRAALQADIDDVTERVRKLTLEYQAANDHRKELQALVKQSVEKQRDAEDKLAESEGKLKRLQDAQVARRSTYFVGSPPFLGKKWLELPVFDGFNSPLRIENQWNDDITIDLNFRRVRRFDRCGTCHQAMQKTAPDTASEPAYVERRELDLVLVAPAEVDLPPPQKDEAGQPLPRTLEQVFGLRLSPHGLISESDAAVSFVRPQSPAARALLAATVGKQPPRNGAELRAAVPQDSAVVANSASALDDARGGLRVGDVIESVNDSHITSPVDVERELMRSGVSGQAIRLKVRRGLPHPFVSHPRLDLFVGSLSPHPSNVFGCTICHEGQGSATAFKWASHTPNGPNERSAWMRQHGWFDNHHWIYPQFPNRFLESSCLKCHHQVTELKPGQRFAEAPAPKVARGHELVEKFACHGCHEINGYKGTKRIGPDLRLEPNVFAAALQLKAEPNFAQVFTPEERGWVEQLIDHPENDATRRRLFEVLERDGKSEQPRFSATARQLASLFKDQEAPGTLRKAGPSLRFVGAKNEAEFLYDWIREPGHFRPSTRMPRFFGLWSHLDDGSEHADHHKSSGAKPGGESDSAAAESSKAAESSGEAASSASAAGSKKRTELQMAQDFEPIEILGMVTYLLERSQRFDYLEPPSGISPSEPAEQLARGKTLFQTRGCVACHQHSDFADAEAYRPRDEIVQGPDLSRVAAKFNTDKGKKWLYSWIKQPSRYHARTLMPDLYLDPIQHRDKDGKLLMTTDPVADIVAYLLSGDASWRPDQPRVKLDEAGLAALDDLTRVNLEEAYTVERAARFAQQGLPPERAAAARGAEVELVVSQDLFDTPAESRSPAQVEEFTKRRLLYIGGKALAKHGCYACHDVPGFEDAKPIGTGLADWGRKNPAQLAFNHIGQYLHHQEAHGHAKGGGQKETDAAAPADHQTEDDRAFYHNALLSGHRAGFAYQKLLEPRSYDYRDIANKKYNERLRMPKFAFTPEEREAVVTFVLGLVADPPVDSLVYHPKGERAAVLEGQRVLEKYNCSACHMLETERWDLAFPPSADPAQRVYPPLPDASRQAILNTTFPFLQPKFPPEALVAQPDRRGLLRVGLKALPSVSDDDALPIVNDDEGDPIDEDENYDPRSLEFMAQLWDHAVIEQEPLRFLSGLPLRVKQKHLERRAPTRGGFLAKYLMPHAQKLNKLENSASKGGEAWGWLPPPLVGEGRKVQPEWLHDFLLDPHPIRPAVMLRMPRFNMTAAEAAALVNYFAAVDGAEFPYPVDARRSLAALEAKDAAYRQELAAAGKGDKLDPGKRFDDAMGLVANICSKCHHVGDYERPPPDRGNAPNLALTYRRLRADYVRDWIAKPKLLLPYTGMPENFKYDVTKPLLGAENQDLYHGDSLNQLDAVVDLLMNFDRAAMAKYKIRERVPKSTPEGQPPAEAKPPADAASPEKSPSDTAPSANDPPKTPAAPAPGASDSNP